MFDVLRSFFWLGLLALVVFFFGALAERAKGAIDGFRAGQLHGIALAEQVGRQPHHARAMAMQADPWTQLAR